MPQQHQYITVHIHDGDEYETKVFATKEDFIANRRKRRGTCSEDKDFLQIICTRGEDRFDIYFPIPSCGGHIQRNSAPAGELLPKKFHSLHFPHVMQSGQTYSVNDRTIKSCPTCGSDDTHKGNDDVGDFDIHHEVHHCNVCFTSWMHRFTYVKTTIHVLPTGGAQ